MGKTAHLGTRILEKSVLFRNKEGACFALKFTVTFNLEKRALSGEQAPPRPLIPPPLNVPLQGHAMQGQ